MRGSSASARVLMVEAHNGQLYLLPEHRPAKFQRIDNDGLTRRITGPTTSNDREQDTGLHHAVAPSVTRDETRNTFDEDRLTFGEAGSSSEAKRWHSTVRSREYRRRSAFRPGPVMTPLRQPHSPEEWLQPNARSRRPSSLQQRKCRQPDACARNYRDQWLRIMQARPLPA